MGGNEPPPWTSVQGRSRGRGRSSSQGTERGRTTSFQNSRRSSYDSSFPVIQHGNKKLVNANISEASSSSSNINIQDIPKDSSLYEQLQAYLVSKQTGDTYASLTKEVEPKRISEEAPTKEIIFLVENSDIQNESNPWNIFQRYLLKGLYFPGESYKTRSYYENILIQTGSAEFQHFTTESEVYNFSKIIIKQIISAKEWGMNTMQEKTIILNKQNMNFTYWDYIQAFDKVFYYNNTKQKHSWFIKICSKCFDKPIPNWMIKWWTFHGPSVNIFPDLYQTLYKEWKKSSPFLANLYLSDHISNIEKIDQMYFFIEFSIPWIHKWNPELGYTPGEQIPCLYRVYYHNFWEKLEKIDPKTQLPFGQELLDQIRKTIDEYKRRPQKIISTEHSIKQIARRISIQDEREKQGLIDAYLEEIKQNLLSELTNSDVSMKSDTSADYADSQPEEPDFIMSATQLEMVQAFVDSTKKSSEAQQPNKGKDKL